MGHLLTRILPLALGAAVSPTVLAVGLLVLSSPRRPVGRGTAYCAGVLLVLGGLTVVGLVAMRHGGAVGGGRDPVTRAVDATVGTLLLLLAARSVLRGLTVERSGPPEPRARGDAAAAGLAAAFLLGAAMMASNISTVVLYLPAMRDVATARVPTADKAFAVALVVFITSLPATLPLAVRLAVPDRSARWFEALHGWVERHQRQLAIAVEVAFGAYLLVRAA